MVKAIRVIPTAKVSEKRFVIISSLQFEDKTTTAERKRDDKYTSIRFEMTVEIVKTDTLLVQM